MRRERRGRRMTTQDHALAVVAAILRNLTDLEAVAVAERAKLEASGYHAWAPKDILVSGGLCGNSQEAVADALCGPRLNMLEHQIRAVRGRLRAISGTERDILDGVIDRVDPDAQAQTLGYSRSQFYRIRRRALWRLAPVVYGAFALGIQEIQD